MKKFYSTLLFSLAAMTAFAQAEKDTTYVMVNFTANPWNYPVTEVTSGWAPDFDDLESPGSILEAKDFSWSLAHGADEKVKITLYPSDWMETYKAPVLGSINFEGADAASFFIPEGKTNVLYTLSGTTMRFEAPAGYEFGKMVFYTYRNSNFLVGDDYEEEGYPYEWEGNTFTQTLKVWKPTSPKISQYGMQIWEGDSKNILFNYPYFSAHFVKIDIRLVPDGTAGIQEILTKGSREGVAVGLDGRTVNATNPAALRKGIYIIDGKKYVVK